MIHFTNPGYLPILAATTMGISAKESDNPIGQFGTGLKYTIAGVLRMGGTITIRIGSDTHTFSTRVETVRGKSFSIVQMSINNGVPTPLGFTLDLGKHWEPWMYVRELWSNCVDEGGSHGYGDAEGDTVILVDCYLFKKAYEQLHTFILQSEPIATTDDVDIHPYCGENTLFYRGIKVGTSMETPLYTYNIKSPIHLTEDRTIAMPWQVEDRLSSAVGQLTDPDIIEELLLRSSDSSKMEYRLVPAMFGADETFRSVLREIFNNTPYKLNDPMLRYAKREFGINKETLTREPTPVERRKISKALDMLEALGLDCPEVNIAAQADENLFGYTYDGRIYITSKALASGVATTASTLLEEYLHAKEDLDDFSRRMQDRLLGIITALYEEHVLKEPL